MWWRLILSVRCILSTPKCMTKIKMLSAKNQEPMGMNICTFSAAQKVCSKLENQAKCDPAVFLTNSLKIHFLHMFRLLEVSFIARANYNCKIGHCAQPNYTYVTEICNNHILLYLFAADVQHKPCQTKIYTVYKYNGHLSQLMRLWYLSHRRPAKAQASLRIRK